MLSIDFSFWFDEQLFSSSVDLCLHQLVYNPNNVFVWENDNKKEKRIFIEKLVCLSFFIDYISSKSHGP